MVGSVRRYLERGLCQYCADWVKTLHWLRNDAGPIVESVAVPWQTSLCGTVQVAAWLQTGSGGGEVSPGLINIIRGESCHDKLNSIYPGT